MRDLPGVIWTRASGMPRKLGSFVVSDDQFRTSYDPEAAGLPPISLALPMEELNGVPYVHHSTETLLYPAFIWSKIPQPTPEGYPRNLQRLIYARAVAALRRPPPGIETDYEILLLAGRDGIGHLDIFRSDEAAASFYDARRKSLRKAALVAEPDTMWSLVRRVVAGVDQDAEALEAISSAVGPTPSVPGMIPKLPAAIPDRPKWDGRMSVPGVSAIGNEPFVDAIVKVEPEVYPGIVALEEIAYQLHRELGFETPRTWRRSVDDGTRLLAIERFDRRGGMPIPMESLFSILSIFGGRNTNVLTPTDSAYSLVADALKNTDPVVSYRARRDQEEFFRRLVISVLTGNGDMHLENIAILGGPNERRLSPVFDPAPMRAYPRHSQLSAVKWFVGDPDQMSSNIPADIADRIERMARACGLKPTAAGENVEELLIGTRDFVERCRADPEVPEHVGQCLDTNISGLRYRIEQHFGMANSRTP